MAEMNAWDVAILVIAAYIAVLTLVRMMRRRRDVAIADLQTQISAELERKQAQRRRDAARSRAKQQATGLRGGKG